MSTSLARPADESSQPLGTGSGNKLPWLLMLAAGLLGFTYMVRPSREINGSSPAVGQPAPSLRLVPLPLGEATTPSLEGALDLNADASALAAEHSHQVQGRVTVVHFWGTWCGPCRSELPDIAELHARLNHHPEYQLFAVSCAAFDDPSLPTLRHRTRTFYRTAGIDLPTFADPSTSTRRGLLRLMQQDQMAYPMTVLVDRTGTITATWSGVPPGGVETILGRVQALLDTPQ